MDKYFIIPKKHLYYYRYSGCEYLNGVEPGTILNGPGSWRCLDNDTVNVEPYGNFKRIIHRNKERDSTGTHGVSGVLILKYFRAYFVSLFISPNILGSVFSPRLFFKYDKPIADITESESGFL